MCSCMIKTSVLPWMCLVISGNLWQSSEIFRKCLEMIVWPLDITLGESLKIFWKLSNRSSLVCSLINRIIQVACRYGVELDISCVRAQYVSEWDIKLNTRREIPYLHACIHVLSSTCIYYIDTSVLMKNTPLKWRIIFFHILEH